MTRVRFRLFSQSRINNVPVTLRKRDPERINHSSKACAVCGEPRKRGAGTYCSIECYRTVQRGGSVEGRFWAKVQKGDGCWLWQGSRLPEGYGQFAWAARYGRTRPVKAHRVAWELTHGPIPDGLCACHHCDNPPCCNPAHLFLGTHTDNMRDASAKGRLSVTRPTAQKVTNEQVLEMKALRAAGWKLVPLAERFGVTKTLVSLIVRGLRRQDISDLVKVPKKAGAAA